MHETCTVGGCEVVESDKLWEDAVAFIKKHQGNSVFPDGWKLTQSGLCDVCTGFYVNIKRFPFAALWLCEHHARWLGKIW